MFLQAVFCCKNFMSLSRNQSCPFRKKSFMKAIKRL